MTWHVSIGKINVIGKVYLILAIIALFLLILNKCTLICLYTKNYFENFYKMETITNIWPYATYSM